MSQTATSASGTRRAGGWLLWSGALGGAVAWTAHLLAAWSINELTCAAGHRDVAGVSLTLVLVLAVVLPAAVTAAALAVSWRAWRRTSAATGADGDRSAGDPAGERALDRARLLAVFGVWANLLFLAIILLGGAAILVFPVCQS